MYWPGVKGCASSNNNSNKYSVKSVVGYESRPSSSTINKMQNRSFNLITIFLFVILIGSLSTGHCAERRPSQQSTSSSSSYTINVWDKNNNNNNAPPPQAAANANINEIIRNSHNTNNNHNNINNRNSRIYNNSTSSVVRAKMEISSSSSISRQYAPAPQPFLQGFNSTVRTQRSSQHPAFINAANNKFSHSNHANLLGNRDEKHPQLRNKPLLNSLVNKIDTLASKLDRLSHVQIQIQKSFDNLESRYAVPPPSMDDLPQCGRRVDRVLRTLSPLVTRVEGLWNIVEAGGGKLAPPVTVSSTSSSSSNSSPTPQFLSSPSNDALLSESRRQERAITAIRSDLNVRSQQIMSEIGTVEHQLDLLQSNLRKFPKSQGSSTTSTISSVPIDEAIIQPSSNGIDSPPAPETDPDSPDNLQFVPNDATFSEAGPNAITNSTRVKSVVFPSVRNKPSTDSVNSDGADALLTGSGQTGSSCIEQLMQGNKRSGLYHVKLPGARSSFWQLLVYCDQETAGGGWMVVQRRADFGEPRESFHRNWIEYRSGFGDPLRELWIGNLNLHLLTASDDQVLRIELEDFDGEKRYAEYSTFRVASESDGFRLEVSGYAGDAGDALSDPWYGAHGSAFSTHDRDNDRSSLNCASMLKGGWWWKSCGRGLNGIYYDVPQQDSAAVLARQGIVWFRWKGWDYTLKKATMMIRPKSFRPSNSTIVAF